MAGFREFIARGNVLELAVAVIIGAAFAAIVTSFTENIIMPIVGAVFGGLDFANYFVTLGPIPAGFAGDATSYADLKEAGVAVLGYGEFITAVVNFLILAFIIYMIVRAATRMKKPAEAPAPTAELLVLQEIRDELRRRD